MKRTLLILFTTLMMGGCLLEKEATTTLRFRGTKFTSRDDIIVKPRHDLVPIPREYWRATRVGP